MRRATPSGALLVAALAAGGCASLPSLGAANPLDGPHRNGGHEARQGGERGRPRREDESGIYALPQGRDAFAARVVFARAAERSLDVQYYIWHADNTGFLLLEELWNSAERGVRVRMLLDDNGIKELDPILAVFDAHPNIEVRVSTRTRTAASNRSATSPISSGSTGGCTTSPSPRTRSSRSSGVVTSATSISAPGRGRSSRTSTWSRWGESQAKSPRRSISIGTATPRIRPKGSWASPLPMAWRP